MIEAIGRGQSVACLSYPPAAVSSFSGIDNLTNVKKGHLTGVMKTWTKRHLTEFGAMLLRKAHVVFQNERCRPVFEADIEGIAARF